MKRQGKVEQVYIKSKIENTVFCLTQ